MRTQFKTVEQQANGKWAVVFETYAGPAGDEYVAAETTSAAVFDTEDEAYEGERRAMDVLEKTGMFPNMCEKF